MYSWGDNRRFYSYSQYLRRQFGGRMVKLALDAGFTCPNRDGTVGTGGCTYCRNDAFNPAYCSPEKSIRQQLEEGTAFHERHYGQQSGYIAYFQAYTNTYAPLPRLRTLLEEATSFPGVRGILIATRPDCLDEGLLDYLERLQEKVFLQLEIGVESFRDDTLRRINRGHDVACAFRAFERAHAHAIPTGTHLIFGLPGETPDDWMADISLLNALPISSVKFHQLQILRNTAIAREYHLKPDDFPQLTMDRYIQFIADYVERLSPRIAIGRFASEVPPKLLEVPGWGGIRYEQVVKAIEEELTQRGTWQGWSEKKQYLCSINLKDKTIEETTVM